MLNILMLGRANLFTHKGGDSIQVEKTALYLNKLQGINVTVKTVDEQVDYSKFDLLHLFNISRPADLLGIIKKSNVPYVISTIYIDYTEAEKNHPSFIRRVLSNILSSDNLEFLKAVLRIIKGQDKLTTPSFLWNGQRKSIKKILKNASLLLPNSESEYRRLQKAYNVDNAYKVIPNAIDINIFKSKSQNEHIESIYKDAILCVGQITAVKNHLRLIEALNNSKYKVFIIGKPASNSVSYFEKCKANAKSNITFVPFVEQNELAKIYESARVHVLASWFETTGLVSLEAMYMGCNIVVTEKGDQKEYFGDYAFYCDPCSPKSIKEAVDRAFEAPINPQAKQYILKQFTWEHTAKATYESYKEALSVLNG